MHRSILSIVVIVIFSSIMAQAQQSQIFDKLLFTADKDTLPYRLLKPVNPQAKKKFPLVIFLHGAGERGNDNEVQIRHISELFLDTRNRGKYPCYLLAPQCAKKEWWASFQNKSLSKTPSRPMQLVIDLIEKTIKEYPIDESRIYITGLSMGGYGTWELIARFPHKFAAAVPVCGGGDPKTASEIKNIPIWAFHGALDKIVAPQETRTMIHALQEAGGKPGFTEYPDIEHNSWINAYREPHLIPWLFEQSLPSDLASKR
jgi:predicted peptidase